MGVGQSKEELRSKIAELEAKILQNKLQLEAQHDSLLALRQRNLELKLQVHTLRDSVQGQTLALGEQQEEKQQDSLAGVAVSEVFKRQQKHLNASTSTVAQRLDKQKFFEEQQLSYCLKFEAYQTLFMETSMLEYELFPQNQRFAGYFKNAYIPDFGEVEFHIERVSGSYSATEEIITLSIEEIEGKPTAIEIKHHLKRSGKSTVHLSVPGSPKLYTREVPLSETDPSECD
jgi:hypothetical protein